MVKKEDKICLGVSASHNIVLNPTAKAFGIMPIDVEIIVIAYFHDSKFMDNTVLGIAERLGKKKEGYLYRTFNKLEKHGYFFTKNVNTNGRGRSSKVYNCTNKAHRVVDEYFLQINAYL
jgi:hypothetical protein